MGKDDIEHAPSWGYCASQNMYYYGYKLHALCSISGVINSYDMTVANVHDLQYLKDVQWEYHDCTILGDKGYLNVPAQLDLFESATSLLMSRTGRTKRTGHRPLGPTSVSERGSRLSLPCSMTNS